MRATVSHGRGNADAIGRPDALDGKALRMSAYCGAADAHLLSLFSYHLSVVLGDTAQRAPAVTEKTNEITASADARAMLLLTGVVITGDAIFTQRAIAATILDAGNDYLFVVKENQPTLHEESAVVMSEPSTVVSVAGETRAHSQRSEKRRRRAHTELVGYTDRPGLAQTLAMERRVTDRRTGETHVEVAYAVPSLLPPCATSDLMACALADRKQNPLGQGCDLRRRRFDRSCGSGAAGLSGRTQPRDWPLAPRWGNEHRRCLSPLRGPTRLGAHCIVLARLLLW